MPGTPPDTTSAVFGAAMATFGTLVLCIYVVWRCMSQKRRPGVCGSAALTLGLVATCLVSGHLTAVAGSNSEVTFDPYDILQLDSSASAAQVRKQYRRLSLKHHPDKCGAGGSCDTERFKLVAKAHACLTDRRARRNWKKFGHPDGPRSMLVSVGLPSWMWENEESQQALLLAYFVLIVLLPGAMFFSCRGSSSAMRVTRDTLEAFAKEISDQQDLAAFPPVDHVLRCALGSQEMTALSTGDGLTVQEDQAVCAAVRAACRASGLAKTMSASARGTPALALLALHRGHIAADAALDSLSPDTHKRIAAATHLLTVLLQAWTRVVFELRAPSSFAVAALQLQARLALGYSDEEAELKRREPRCNLRATGAVIDDGEPLEGIHPLDVITVSVLFKWDRRAGAKSDPGTAPQTTDASSQDPKGTDESDAKGHITWHVIAEKDGRSVARADFNSAPGSETSVGLQVRAPSNPGIVQIGVTVCTDSLLVCKRHTFELEVTANPSALGAALHNSDTDSDDGEPPQLDDLAD